MSELFWGNLRPVSMLVNLLNRGSFSCIHDNSFCRVIVIQPGTISFSPEELASIKSPLLFNPMLCSEITQEDASLNTPKLCPGFILLMQPCLSNCKDGLGHFSALNLMHFRLRDHI